MAAVEADPATDLRSMSRLATRRRHRMPATMPARRTRRGDGPLGRHGTVARRLRSGQLAGRDAAVRDRPLVASITETRKQKTPSLVPRTTPWRDTITAASARPPDPPLPPGAPEPGTHHRRDRQDRERQADHRRIQRADAIELRGDHAPQDERASESIVKPSAPARGLRSSPAVRMLARSLAKRDADADLARALDRLDTRARHTAQGGEEAARSGQTPGPTSSARVSVSRTSRRVRM